MNTIRQLCRRTAMAACVLAFATTAEAASSAQTYEMHIFISGLRPTSSAALSPSSYQFPGTVVGSNLSQVFSFTNTGSTVLTVGAAQVSAPYSVTNGCAGTLSPGMSCSETVTFAPTAAGSFSSTLSVPVGSVGNVTATLSGTGTEAQASLNQGALAFGNQQVSTSSTAQGVTLTNTGTAPLSIGSIAASGPYSATSNCGSTLAVNGSCSINVVFAPTATGSQSGTLSIPTGLGTSTVTLSGTGISSALALSTSALSYGLVLINTQSAGQAVVVTNNDAQPVKLGALALPAGAVLTQDACSNATLAAGGQCQATIALAPTATGSIATNVTVPNASYGTSSTIALTGYGGNNDALIGPVSAAYANGSAVWNTTGAGTTAPVGQVHFEALVTNNSTTTKTVTFWVSVDDEVDGLKVSGVQNGFTCIVANATCTSSTSFTLAPGVSRIDILGKNNGGPASLNLTVTDQSTGTVLLNTANTSSWYWTTTSF